MTQPDRFKQAVIVKLAQRAANRCSNPACNAITSGPTADPHGSINVGEAAHIFGANPGSARYDPAMQPQERSAISNGLWLCGNCHKIIDDDPELYPAGLLFEWQREHQNNIASIVGKAGADIRKRYEDRLLGELGRLSYLAQRIVLEKDEYWEHRLTVEILRFEMSPTLRRWKSLERGLYLKPYVRITETDFMPWLESRIAEITVIASAFSKLANEEFHRSWGELGVPGDEKEIIETSRLYSELCKSALDWEESVRFVTLDSAFTELKSLFIGTAGRFIDEAEKLPTFISDTLERAPVSGQAHLTLVLDLPEGWSDAVMQALAKAHQHIRMTAR